jgi:hypothetical protein
MCQSRWMMPVARPESMLEGLDLVGGVVGVRLRELMSSVNGSTPIAAEGVLGGGVGLRGVGVKRGT